MPSGFRALPSVDRLLSDPLVGEAARPLSHTTVVEVLREELDLARGRIAAGEAPPDPAALAAAAARRLTFLAAPRLRPAINATGVILHTNLGRAPLSAEAAAAAAAVAAGYSNLELELATGERGSRHDHVAELVRRVTGAEAALVVNNNASAVLLLLSVVAAGRTVVLSRGQAVEIGGGFRIPDVMQQSGARLVEVGTTNRTYLQDYEAAIEADTAALLRVHSSNFQIVGFTHQVELPELVDLGNRAGVPVIDDLGSGALLDTAAFGLQHEPMVQESVAAGVAAACFSGDKLLGGPQAGIIVGRSDLVARARRHPLARALRMDKMDLAALQVTLLHYLRGEALEKVPLWRMIAAPLEELRRRAHGWARALDGTGALVQVVQAEATVGGGSLPGATLPTYVLSVAPPEDASALAGRLRHQQPPIVARIEHERVMLDPRTVAPAEDELVSGCLRQLLLGAD